MTKWGRGVLLVITDAAPEFEAEFNEWYDREHLKDRVATTGFLSARRYVASEAVRKYLAVYETESIAVFESPAYKQKLAEQTDWSKRILKQFRNPHRAVTRFGASQGFCVGGVASIAILAGGPAQTDFAQRWRTRSSQGSWSGRASLPHIYWRVTRICPSPFLNILEIRNLPRRPMTGSSCSRLRMRRASRGWISDKRRRR